MRTRTYKLAVETLEDRTSPAVFTTNTGSPVESNMILPVAEQLEREPNNTLAQANPIILHAEESLLPNADYVWWYGPPKSGLILGSLSANDIDHYQFTSDAQRQITVQLSGPAASGATIQLLSADGKVLVSGNNVTLKYYTTAGGTFYMRIVNATATGDYLVQVRTAADNYHEHEPNDTFNTQNPIFLITWVSLNGTVYEFDKGPQSGHMVGLMDPHVDGSADQDFYSFSIGANRTFHLELTGNLAARGSRITLYDAFHNKLAADPLKLDWTSPSSLTYFVRIDRTGSAPVNDPLDTEYKLAVTTEIAGKPLQGPTEIESNETVELANPIPLNTLLPDDGSGITMRSGAATGIAGGPNRDQDFFKFEVKAGEQVRVGLDGFVRNARGIFFPTIADWIRADHIRVAQNATFADLVKANPGVTFGAVQMTIYDSSGNPVGTSSDNGAAAAVVGFTATADGTYYARITTTGTSIGHYRLSVLAESTVKVDKPFVKVLRAGQRFDFTDAAGHRVKVALQNTALGLNWPFWLPSSATMTITFTGTRANGSDIASIVINGSRGESLSITSAAGTRVGKLVIHGARGFGAIRIDGSLGILTSDVNIGAVVVNGILGAIAAPGQRIGVLKAQTFDTALLQVAGVSVLQVKNNPNARY